MVASPHQNAQGGDAPSDVLPPGTPLFHGQYTIESFLSSGGFGITYMARDSLDRLVVVKECFPHALCVRDAMSVRSRPRTPREDFHSIVRMFVQEARNLSKLKHPNIVGVHQIFECNGTAYMALDYIPGRELLDAIEDGKIGQTPAETQALLQTMLDTVEFIHDQGVLHRDISPDNILVKADNTPVLIDFGAARAGGKLTEKTRTQLLAVKDGYSPQEFYISGSKQGPASDLYALAATFYHLITGEAPPNSDERLAAAAENAPDPLVPIRKRAKGYDPRFLEAIDKALKVFPKDRFQSALEWKAYINGVSAAKPDVSMSLALARRREAVRNNSQAHRLERPELLKKSTPHLKVVTAGDVERAMPRKAAEAAAPTAEASAPVTPPEIDPAVEAGREAGPQEAAPATTDPETATRDALTAAFAEPEITAKKSTSRVGFLMGGAAGLALAIGAAVFLTGKPDAPADEAVVLEAAEGNTGGSLLPAGATRSPALTAPASDGAFDGTRPASFQAVTAATDASSELGGAGPAASTDVALSNTSTDPDASGPGGSVLDAQAVMTGWDVGLPFTTAATGTEIQTVTPDAPFGLRPGRTVASVNGIAVRSVDDIRRRIIALGEPSPDGTWSVDLGLLRQGVSGERVVETPVRAVYETVLLNGVAFEATAGADGWRTTVTDSPFGAADALLTGDVVIAYMPTNRVVDGPATLSETLIAELAAGQSQFNFAVERDGDLWVVSMAYAPGVAD